jgi:hypothetical protein
VGHETGRDSIVRSGCCEVDGLLPTPSHILGLVNSHSDKMDVPDMYSTITF